MPLDNLRHAVRQLLLEQGEDDSAPTVDAVVQMLTTVSQMRATGRMDDVPVEKLIEYVDGALPENERRDIEEQTQELPAAMADLEMVRAMPSLEEADKLDIEVPDEMGRRILDRVKERISEEALESQSFPFEEALERQEAAKIGLPVELMGMAASWIGPLLLAIEGCRQLLFITQAEGPVFMGGPSDLQQLPEVDWEGGNLGVKVARAGDTETAASQVWLLDNTGRILHRATIDEAGYARFADLTLGKYRVNTDRGFGEVKTRLP